jgi:hypothetical protein
MKRNLWKNNFSFTKDITMTYNWNYIFREKPESITLAQNWPVNSVTEWERERRVRVEVASRAVSHSGHHAWEYRFWFISSNTWRVMSLPLHWSRDHLTRLPYAQSALYFLRTSTTWRLHNLCRMNGHRLCLVKGSAVLLRTFVVLKANSHMPCHVHAAPMSCRTVKGLDCVFPI